MIETLNERFVCTWVIIDDITRKIGGKHPALANTLLTEHQYPFDFFFFSSTGEYIARLTSFQDLPDADPAVGHPHRSHEVSHVDVFLQAVAAHFGPG